MEPEVDRLLVQDAEDNGGDMEMFDRAIKGFDNPQKLLEYFLNHYYFGIRSSATVIEMILKRVDPSLYDNEAVIRCSLHGNSAALKVFLKDARVDPTAQNNEAIIAASRTGHYYVERKVKRLLDLYRGLDLNGEASSWVYNEILNEEAKNSVNSPSHGYFDVVSMLLEDPRVASTLDGDIYDTYVQPFLNAYNKFELMHRASLLNGQFINPWLLRDWMPRHKRKYED